MSGFSEKLVCWVWEFCFRERFDMLDVFRLIFLSVLYCFIELFLLRIFFLCCFTLFWLVIFDANIFLIFFFFIVFFNNRFLLFLLGKDLVDNRGWKLKFFEVLGVRFLEFRFEGRDVWDLYFKGFFGGVCRAGRFGFRFIGLYRRDRFCICRCMFCIFSCCMVICCRYWFRVSISCCCCNCCCRVLG